MHTTEQLKTALAGRYEIDRHIGEGGMATVYLARDVRHNRKVALKVLKADLGAVLGPERFLSEIEVTANLQHPNLLPLFDSGAVGGVLFYVMPFIDGESLRARLDREKQLPIEDAVRIATAIAGALDYAHRRGVIHRDLKPENILLHDGQPLVADFGIALAVSNAGGNRITQTGLSLGTPQYMSPEQATGDRQIDARSDIYSLGAMTYEMLTGEAPHTGSTSQAIIARVLTETPRRIRVTRPNVPEHVEASVFHALEKLAADRWATPKEFAEALAGARPVTMPATSATSAQSAQAFPLRYVPTRRVGGLAVALAVGVITGIMLRPNRAAAPAVRAEFEVQFPDSLAVGIATASPVMAMSRDGSFLVFQGVRAGLPPALYIRRLGDRAVQMIRGTEGGRYPVLSPDESELVFLPATGVGAMRRVSITGGTPREVVDSAQPPTWSDKSDIIYELQSSIWMVSPDGGTPRLIATPDSSRGHVHYQLPHALPGGNAALIGIRRGVNVADSTLLGVITIPGGKVTELPIRGLNPRYSATGHILYATSENIIFAVPFSLRSLRVTGAPIAIAEGVFVAQSGGAAFAASGTGTVAYVSGGTGVAGGQVLVAVSRTGVERTLALRPGHYRWPRVSPDGQQIAMTAFTGPSIGPAALGPNPDIWRYSIRGDAFNRVTTDSLGRAPEWNAAGDQIAYTRGRQPSADSLAYARPLYRAGEATPIFRVLRGRVLEVSIDRTRGYVAARVLVAPQRNDIYVAHMDSLESARPLLAAPYTEMSPRISPDGRWIAYVTDKTGTQQVYVRALHGSGPEVLVSNELSGEPVWAPNSRELFYRTRSGYMMSARLVTTPRLDVTSRDSLFPDKYLNAPGANYDIFPDGNEFVFVKQNAPASANATPLIVVVNWNASTTAKRAQ